MAPIVGALECFSDLARLLVDCLAAPEVLALCTSSLAWLAALAHQDVWKRFLVGPVELLVRPVLAEPASRAAFAGALRVGAIHPDNVRAIVAALCTPQWLQFYPSMRRLLPAGRLRVPLWKQAGSARRLKALALRQVQPAKQKDAAIAGAGRQLKRRVSREDALRNELEIGISMAQRDMQRLASASTSACSLQTPSTPKRAAHRQGRLGSSPPRWSLRTPPKLSPPRLTGPPRHRASYDEPPSKVARRVAEARLKLPRQGELVFFAPGDSGAMSGASSASSSSSSSSSSSDSESSTSTGSDAAAAADGRTGCASARQRGSVGHSLQCEPPPVIPTVIVSSSTPRV